MKTREFNALINSVRNKKSLDYNKIKELSVDVKNKAIDYMLRNRHPIVTAFINPTDMSKLFACGYNRTIKSVGVEFLCTCENYVHLCSTNKLIKRNKSVS